MKFTMIIDEAKDEEVVATVHSPSALTEQLEALVRSYGGNDRIAAYTEDDWKLLAYTDIECITVQNGKTYAMAADKKCYRLKQRLYELEPLLPASFIRINKSTLANETALDRFAVTYAGSVDAVFKCGYRDYVSRRCFAQIKRRFIEK